MTYEEFVTAVVANMKALLSKDLEGTIIEPQRVEKLQGRSYYGVSFKTKDSDIAAALDLQDVYETYLAGENLSTIAAQLVEQFTSNAYPAPHVSAQDLTDYNRVLPHLYLQMIAQDGNEAMLSKIPHKNVEDMAMVYRIDIPVDPNTTGSALVTMGILKSWNISEEKLYADAMIHCPQNFPARIRGMSEVMAEMTGLPIDVLPPDKEQMFVVTCKDGTMGAGCIGYPDFMLQASRIVNGSFFLLPSSIHEVLLVRDDRKTDYHDLEEMVKTVNLEEVAPEDRLTNSVYHYDAKTRKFERASDHAQRVKEKTPDFWER